MKVHFAFHLKIKVLESEGTVARMDMSLADVNSCYFSFFFITSKSTQPTAGRFLEHFMLPLADKSYRDVNFLFQQDLAPGHSPKTATMLLIMLLLSVIGQPNQLT